jgi:hypothetical protein
VQVHGPTIEGCGEYWEVDNNLRIPNHNIWVPGDSSGIFRGIVPSMVSGYYVAQEVLRSRSAVIRNQIVDDVSYSHTYPDLKGSSGRGLHEVHIFLEPINPAVEDVRRYEGLVQKYNELRGAEADWKPMKACWLALEFRKAGEVCVMQSARYLAHVVQECHRDAEWFRAHGFNVVREKIESTISGISRTAEEMAQWSSKYFEFRVRIQHKDGDESKPLATRELEQLKALSRQFSLQYQIPIPLSYNKSKGIEGIHQRFLNVRFRGIGSLEAIDKVNKLRTALDVETPSKVISEWVWYDSFPQLDYDWIDFAAGETLADL